MTAVMVALAGAAGVVAGLIAGVVACAFYLGREGVCEHCVGQGQYEVD